MSRRKLSPHFSRRSFLKTLGAGVAGATVAGSLPRGVAAEDELVGTHELTLHVNGKRYDLRVESRETLAEVIRDRLGLTGTKLACERGQCGSCTVNLDGASVYSCHMLALDAHGKQITTVEGLNRGEELHPLQEAFVKKDGLQCGYCTSGQVMTAHALLEQNPHASKDEIQSAMAGNLCRCGAYPKIVDSVLEAKKSYGGGE